MAQWHRILNWFHRIRISREIDEELRFHIDERIYELTADGMSPSEARREAARQFGNVTLYQEKTRNADVPPLIQDLLNDIVYAVRSLRHAPVFTAAVVLTLALGIGATTAIYSVVHTVWLKPLPFRDAGHIVRIWETNFPLGIRTFSASPLNYLSWCERSSSFESLVAMQGGNANLNGQGDPERVGSLAVTAHFFDALGIPVLRGRSFTAGEDQPGRSKVIMLSDRLWRQRYGGDPNLIGRTILVNGENRTVIGIAPLEVAFANTFDLWEPLILDPSHENRGDHHIVVLGRLKPGVSLVKADAELNALATQLEREFPKTNQNWRVRMAPILDWIVDRDTRTALIMLTATVCLLLFIACINVANLQLARASSRVREFGIRMALGAGGWRLVRQLITETLVLVCAGGVVGLLVALVAINRLRVYLPTTVSRGNELSLDITALGMAFAVMLVAGLVLGLTPAWLALRTDVRASLQQTRAAGSARRLRVRQVLVAGEFALATVLVVGASLLLASFTRLQAVSLGFEPHHILTARISLPEARYSVTRATEFYRNLQTELKALPGVEAVGLASNVPFGGGNSVMDVSRGDEAPANGSQAFQASWRIATPDYFTTMRIPLLRGRLFYENEPAGQVPVLLDESLRRRLWPDGSDPIGKLVRLGLNKPMTVVGIVGEVRQLDLTADPAPAVYLPPSWTLSNPMVVVMRTTGKPDQLATVLRRTVSKLDPQQPIFDARSVDELLDANSAGQRLNTFLVGAFALLALSLGIIGVAGVVSYSVMQRTPEIAIRMALGATPQRIVRTVTAGGLGICCMGLVIGLAGAAALGRGMARLLYQVQPDDPAIYAVVTAGLLSAALVSSWLPARQIARINPVTALRKE